jgi:hypothetical protein
MEYNPYVGQQGNEMKALELQTMAYYTKCFSVIDMFMALMNVITGLYPTMLLALCSYVGYLGATRFDKTYVMIYAVYQVFLLTGRILLFWYVVERIDPVLITYNVLTISVNGYITYFLIRFYTSIPHRDVLYVERVSNI